MNQTPIGAPSIALLEDDRTLRESLRGGLRKEGFRVFAAATGAELLDMLTRVSPDAMVLDIGLPDSDGRDVALAIRARGVVAPILFLSARSGMADRLSGFSSGGDDYLPKPFVFEELVARLRALTRRARADSQTSLGDAVIDPVNLAVSSNGVTVNLSSIEFRLIAALAGCDGVMRRSELVRAGWPPGEKVAANTLDTYIARLRKKLEPLNGAIKITTVYAVGYRVE